MKAVVGRSVELAERTESNHCDRALTSTASLCANSDPRDFIAKSGEEPRVGGYSPESLCACLVKTGEVE